MRPRGRRGAKRSISPWIDLIAPRRIAAIPRGIRYDRGVALARLVVIEGPDLGRSFDIPMRGGAIGRGGGAVVLLSDLAVSRQQAMLELRDGAVCLVDEASRNKTLVNGQPVTVHR